MSTTYINLPTESLLSDIGQKFMQDLMQQDLQGSVAFIHAQEQQSLPNFSKNFTHDIVLRIKKFQVFCQHVQQKSWIFIMAQNCYDTHFELALFCGHIYQFQEQRVGWSVCGPFHHQCPITRIFQNSIPQAQKEVKKRVKKKFAISWSEVPQAYLEDFFKTQSNNILTYDKRHDTPHCFSELSMKQHFSSKMLHNDSEKYETICAYHLIHSLRSNNANISSQKNELYTYAIPAGQKTPPRELIRLLLQQGHTLIFYHHDSPYLQQRIESLYKKIKDKKLWERVLWCFHKPDQKKMIHLTCHENQTVTFTKNKTQHHFAITRSETTHSTNQFLMECKEDIPSFMRHLNNYIFQSRGHEFLIHIVRHHVFNEIVHCSRYFQNDMQNILQSLQDCHLEDLSQPGLWEKFLLHWGHNKEGISSLGLPHFLAGFDRWSQIRKHSFHKESNASWSATELSLHLSFLSHTLRHDLIQQGKISEQAASIHWDTIIGFPKEHFWRHVTPSKRRLHWEAQIRWPNRRVS